MKAMILAAGRGERMRPLTDATPKPLLSVGGKYLILFTILKLKQAGVVDLVVNVSHLAEQIERALGDGAQFGVRISYSFEREALETAGGIAWALPMLDELPFLVVNSDVYSDYDFTHLKARAQTLSEQQSAHLVLVDNPEHHPQGDFGLRDGVVSTDGPRFTFSGIGAYHPALFAGITRGEKCRLAARLAQPIAEGRVSGEHFRGEWNDVGTPQRLAELDARLRDVSAD
ncbi:MAG TPA: nucleotidyltransferase family protein [Burkholderiales bacterium]|nr:nucleotidyltransferase family protein [Burkholderiales bacterium]